MSADPTSIDNIRNATFASARRGYRKQDVDQFLAGLADWMASGEGREQSVLVKEALQQVGRQTGSILTTAEEAAQEIREKAQKTREDANAYAKQKREQTEQNAAALKESSEAEAERTRTVATRDAEEMISKAKAEVRAIVADGETKKSEIGAEIEELRERRDSIVRKIDELAVQLTGTADEHRLAAAQASGNGESDTPTQGGAKKSSAQAAPEAAAAGKSA
jgi:DivIVA domain-containing protein